MCNPLYLYSFSIKQKVSSFMNQNHLVKSFVVHAKKMFYFKKIYKMFLWQAVQSSPELFFRPMDPSAQPVTPYCPSKRYLPPLSSCRRRVCSIIASFLALAPYSRHAAGDDRRLPNANPSPVSMTTPANPAPLLSSRPNPSLPLHRRPRLPHPPAAANTTGAVSSPDWFRPRRPPDTDTSTLSGGRVAARDPGVRV